MYTVHANQHRPPPVTFTADSVIQRLRHIVARDPAEYVRRGARAMLNRILGPGWRLHPTPRPADARLSPEQRKQFHLHPVPLPDDLATILISDGDSPEDEDDYW